MAEDTLDDSPSPRKGRGNAILTYETVAEIASGLTRVEGKVDNFAEKVADIKLVHVDHEVRLRALELARAATPAAQNNEDRLRALELQQAGSTTRLGVGTYVLGLAIAIVPIVFTVLNYLKP